MPLEGRALEIVARHVREARAARTLRLCFAFAPSTVNHHWSIGRERMEIDSGIRLHDLRHDFISVLANSGVPLPVVQRLAGHTQLATTAGYIHDDPAALRAAMKARAEGVQE